MLSKYVNLSYDQIVAIVNDYLSIQYPALFQHVSVSDLSQALIEAFAYVTDNQVFNLNTNYNETFLTRAQIESNITERAYEIGYMRQGATCLSIATSGIPASAMTSATITGQYSSQTVSTISSVAGVKFTTWPFDSPESTLYEGAVNVTQVSVGSIQASGPLGSITISTGAVEPANGKVVVMVNGTPWIPFDGLVDPTVAVANRTQFFVQYNSNSIVIYFGNGYVLPAPPANSTFDVYYLSTHGAQIGNPTLTFNGVSGPVTVSTYPSDVEDQEAVRYNAPRNLWTRGRYMTAKDIEWGIISQLPSAKVKGVSSGFGTTPVDNYINQLNFQFTDLASYAATSSPASGDSTLQLKIDSSEVTWGALKSNLSSIIYNNTFSPLITMYVVTTTATPGVLTTVDSATLSNIQTNIQGKVAEGTVVQLISTASYLVTSTVEYALTMLPGYSLLTGQTATEAEIGAYFDALNYGDEISTQDLYSNIKTNVDGVDSIVIYLNLNPAANVTLTNVFGTLSDGASGALYFTPDDGYIFTLPATNSFVRL